MSANKEGKKPQYKDYVTFLESFKNGKKEETNCNSLTNSSNNSSTSINSDHLNEAPSKGFKVYLENYDHKKFSSVKPTFSKKDVSQDNKKTVKTEIFINISNDKTSVSNISKVFENSDGIDGNDINVSKVTKLFEKNSNGGTITKTVSPKVNKFNAQQSESENNSSEEKKISVEEISKKFQAGGENHCGTFKTKRTTLKKQDSIKEKSKIFETNANESDFKKEFTNDQNNKKNSFREPGPQTDLKKEFPLPPKPPLLKIEQKSSQNGVNGRAVSISPPLHITYSDNTPKLDLNSENVGKCISPAVCVSSTNNIPPPPPIPEHNQIPSKQNFPPPPPLPVSANKEQGTGLTNSDNSSKSMCPSNTSSPPVMKTTDLNSSINIPIPPPPPPNNFSTKVISPSAPNKANNMINSKKNQVSGYSTLPRMQSNKPKDALDNIPVPTLDKSDPRVKKLVYGALRDMYGAYHGQANDYIATLPKNRVRKNNGLDSIINNIA